MEMKQQLRPKETAWKLPRKEQLLDNGTLSRGAGLACICIKKGCGLQEGKSWRVSQVERNVSM